jgi:protein TonB
MANSGAKSLAPATPSAYVHSLFGDAACTYEVKPFNFCYSLLIHAGAIALILFLAHVTVKVVQNPHQSITQLLSPIEMPFAPDTSHGGGGGGARELLPASKGTPPKASMEQLTPPTLHVMEKPNLPAPPSVIVPNVALPTSNTIGDLKGVLGPASDGTGHGGGLGNGSGGGVGSGDGRGVGPGKIAGIGDGIYHAGHGVSQPRLIFEVDPEFSEEARKAKYQGSAQLQVVIGPDGLVRDAKVVAPLGMGLDEKAIEAVRKWKFDPAKKDGRPVAVYAMIEVNFHLY